MTEFGIDLDAKHLADVVHNTTSSLTFVNFEEKKWATTWPTIEDRLLLDMCNYHVIDDPIADTIMRLNSIEDVSTTCCCSGHLDYPEGGYIWFNTITAQVQAIMQRLKYWRVDSKDTYRIRNIGHVRSLWFDAIKELHEAFKDFPNNFEHCNVLNTGESTRIVTHDLFEKIEEIDEASPLAFYEIDRDTLSYEQKEVLRRYDESVPVVSVVK